MSHREYISPRMESIKAAQIDRQHERTGCNPFGMIVLPIRKLIQYCAGTDGYPELDTIRPTPKTYEITGSSSTRRVRVEEGLNELLCAIAGTSDIKVVERDGNLEFFDENEHPINPKSAKTLRDTVLASPQGTQWTIEPQEIEISTNLEELLVREVRNYYGSADTVIVSIGSSDYDFFVAQFMRDHHGRKVPCGHTKIANKKLLRKLREIMNDVIISPQQAVTASEMFEELKGL